jgi:nicotinic acid mononucleotide adenylyltransferase
MNETELQERVNHVNAFYGGRVTFLDVPYLEPVSSSMARNVRQEDELKQLLPAKVAEYIVTHKLYGFHDEALHSLET